MLPVSFAHWTTIAIWHSCWQGISHLWWRLGGRWERSLMPLFSFQIMGLFSFYARSGIHDAFQWQSQRYATSAMLQGGVTGWWFRNCNPFSVLNNAQRACTVIFFLFSFPPWQARCFPRAHAFACMLLYPNCHRVIQTQNSREKMAEIQFCHGYCPWPPTKASHRWAGSSPH